MLTRERMERMIDAKDSGEAAKVLSECGYGELTQLTSAALEELLADAGGTPSGTWRTRCLTGGWWRSFS